MIWHMWKHVSYALKILNLIIFYYHLMPWFVCWVLSGFIGQEWLKGWKENIQKWKESTKWSPWRNCYPRDRMDDVIACQLRISSDAAAWLTRPRGKEKLRMTRPCDPRGRVTEATHQKLQKTLPVISETLFGPNPSPEGIDQRLWSERMHSFKGSWPI